MKEIFQPGKFVRKKRAQMEKTMKYYEKTLELGCFNKSKVMELTGSEAAAKSLLLESCR